jgi:NTP pyrophosphatase (non-canonical NTP hydrolase)
MHAKYDPEISTLRHAASGLNELSATIHERNVKAGWWSDLDTGEDTHETRNKGELLMLFVTEIAEMYEGIRKNLPDSHLPHRSAEEVEAADLLIRVFDYAGARRLDLTGAVLEKLEYNAHRADHKPENRRGIHGKKT